MENSHTHTLALTISPSLWESPDALLLKDEHGLPSGVALTKATNPSAPSTPPMSVLCSERLEELRGRE